MKRNIALLSMCIALLFGCNKTNTANYRYQNTFDNYVDYGFSHPTLRSGNAHSGEWYCQLDSITQYSITYSKKIKDLPVKNPKKVKLSAWLYLPTFDAKANVVVTIGEQGKEPALWQGLNSEELVDNEKHWTQVSGEVALPANLNPEHTLMVYVWNHGKEPVWVDDVAFDFE